MTPDWQLISDQYVSEVIYLFLHFLIIISATVLGHFPAIIFYFVMHISHCLPPIYLADLECLD